MKDSINLQLHWFNKCKKFSENQLRDLYYYVIRYWLYGEEIGEIDDVAVDAVFGFIKDQIDLMESRAKRKSGEFQIANEARHQMGNAEKVRELLEENPDYSSKEIAALLGISDSTVRGYDVWKQRKMLKNALENVEETLGSVEKTLVSNVEGVGKNVEETLGNQHLNVEETLAPTLKSTRDKRVEYDF